MAHACVKSCPYKPYKFNFSFKLNLEIQPQVKKTKHVMITSILQGVCFKVMVGGREVGRKGIRHFRRKHFRRRNIGRMEHSSNGTFVERKIRLTEHFPNG